MPLYGSFRRRPAPLFVLLALLAGCAPRPVPVARVGAETISVDQFLDAARGNEAQYQGAPDSAKSALLEDLVRRNLLVQEARRRNLLADSSLKRMREQESKRLAVDRLVEVMVPKDVPVSDAEIEAFYKRREVEAHMLLLFVLEKSQAEAAKVELDKGADFATVANKYNPPGMLPPGGDLGFLPPGALLEPLDQALFDGATNQVLGPLEIKGQGWALTRILERRPRKQEPLDAQKATLKNMIRQRKLRDLQQAAFTQIKDQYRIQLEPGAGQTLFMRFNNPHADTTSLSHALARYDSKGPQPGVYRMADALLDMQDASQQRPNLTNLPLVEHWIELQVVRRASQIEALRRHLDEDPSVRRRVDERMNNVYLDRIYTAEVSGKINEASPEEVQAAYQRRAQAFVQVNAVKVRTLAVPDSAAAVALAEHAGHGTTTTLAALAAMLPAPLKATSKVVEHDIKYPTKDEMWSGLQTAFTTLNPGDVRGPMRTPKDGWMFLELVKKDQSTQPYDKLSPDLQHALAQEALELKRDKRLSTFTDSLRTAAKIEIYHDRLKKIPWPVPRTSPES